MNRFILAAALLGLPLPAGGVDAFRAAVPAFQVHTSREGLPQNTVSAMVHDREGRLWVATQDGLAVWNGRAWRVHDLPDRQVSNFLRCLATTADGSLWAGRQDGGLARFQQGRWELVPPEQLGARRVDALLEARGTLWAATPAGLFRQDGARWIQVVAQPCRSLDGLDGRIWVGLERGVGVLAEDGSLDPAPGRGLETAALNRLLRRQDGTLLAATEQGLFHWNGSRWIRAHLPSRLADQGVSSLAETTGPAGSTLWVGTGDGLAVEEAGGWRILGNRDGLPGRNITALLPESHGLWIGINEGLAFHQPGLWRAFTESGGLPSPSVFCVGEAQGTLWLGCREGGLARLEADGRWRIFTRKDGLPVDGVFSLREHDGQLWAGTAGAGVARWEGGRWTSARVPAGLGKGSVRRLEVDRQGLLWAVTGNRGLWRRIGGRWEEWTPPAATLPTLRWHSLLDSGEHGLWLGSEGAGLLRVQHGRSTLFDRAGGFPNNTVMSLLSLRRGDGRPVLLAGTEGSGLLWTLLDEEPRWQVISDATEPALPNNTVYQIQADDQGRVYLFTNRGAARLTHGFGLAVPARIETFTTESGLPSNEFNGGASLRDSRGRIWAGTVAGAAGFDPAQEPPAQPLPALVLESATAGGKQLAAGLALSHRDRPFRIEAALLAFHRPGEIRYRSQIEGLEEQPGTWTVQGQREFPSLPAGSYVLNFWARDHLGRVAGPLSLPFQVKPAPWATVWAFLLYVLAGAGLLAFWVRWRLRSMTRRNAELEQRIRDRTRVIEEQRDRIAQLMASTAASRLDLGAWARGAAAELATTLGTGPIGVFALNGRHWTPLTEGHGLPAPAALGAAAGRDPDPAGPQPTLAVRGPSGDLQGAVVLGGGELPEHDLGILRGFAAQLGAMLELQQTQEALRQSRLQRVQAQQTLAGRSASRVQICPRCSRCYPAQEAACSVDGAALGSPHLLPHCLQGRYELQRLLGEGGMGLVFRARDLRLGREVAVKVLKPDSTGPDGPARFRQEAHALAAIHHPGVVAIYDSGELEAGAAFLVTELLEGHSLNDLLRAHGRGSFPQVAKLLRQSSAALGAAHGAGLLHRDLKPANLYLVPEPGGFQAKLLDFGLAKSLRSSPEMSHSGGVIGTPNYMSPEQVRGLSLDARSDVWSFAALAFEALTGRRLVETTNMGEAFLLISQGRFPAPSAWIPSLPFAVDRAFLMALHLEPAARPWDVEVWVNSFAKHLEAQVDSIPGWPIGSPPDTQAKADPPTLEAPLDNAGDLYRTPPP